MVGWEDWDFSPGSSWMLEYEAMTYVKKICLNASYSIGQILILKVEIIEVYKRNLITMFCLEELESGKCL